MPMAHARTRWNAKGTESDHDNERAGIREGGKQLKRWGTGPHTGVRAGWTPRWDWECGLVERGPYQVAPIRFQLSGQFITP